MVRIDIWDVQKPEDSPPIECGFSRGFAERYEVGKLLGKGGFGRVNVVTETCTGRQYACKSIAKRLDVQNLSPQKQAAYLDNVRREVAVLQKLKGVLSVAQLKETLEDDKNIYIIMEYCKGGELLASLGRRHYGEGTVASYMRAVLRTLVQCHAQHILHRDIKPGNFMLLEDSPLSPVKAIDFGLAVFFEANALPRRDLGLEGTPWFMSPEMLSSEVGPPADVWAVGVMAYQLLCGYLPFDDHKNRESPALSKVWRAILTEEVSFKGKHWEDVPDSAKDFIRQLLNKDPTQRPTAKQALQHEWLKDRHKADRASGAPLSQTVVQRIQRYGQGNVLKRSILELIAEEIIKMVPDTPDVSHHGNGAASSSMHVPVPGGVKREAEEATVGSHPTTMDMLSSFKRRKSRRDLHLPDTGPGGGAMEGPPLIHRDHHSVHGGLEYFQVRGESVHHGQEALRVSGHSRPMSVHGGRNYWRMMRMAAASRKALEGEQDSDYARYIPRCNDEREEQQKVARLAMDTSKHASTEYNTYLRHFSTNNLRKAAPGSNSSGEPLDCIPSPLSSASMSKPPSFSSASMSGSKPPSLTNMSKPPSLTNMSRPPNLERVSAPKDLPKQMFPSASPKAAEEGGEDRRVRGNHAYRQFLQGYQGSFNNLQRHSSVSPKAADTPYGSLPRSNSMEIPQRNANSLDISRSNPNPGNLARISSIPDLPGMPRMKKVSFGSLAHTPGGTPVTPRTLDTPESSQHGSQHNSKSYWDTLQTESRGKTPPVQDTPERREDSMDLGVQEMRSLMRRLNFSKEVESVSEEELAEGLKNLGYRLRPEEMSILAQQMDPQRHSGAISKYAFLASQIDWHRDDLRELWIEAAKRVFQGFENKLGGGKFSYALLTDMIRRKVPEREIEYAVEDALVAGGYADEEELDFEGFMRLLKADKVNNLAYFESRLPAASRDINSGQKSAYASDLYSPSTGLPSVAED